MTTDLEHGLKAVNDHLARWRDEARGLPLRGCRQRARLRELEARALAATKKLSEARAAVEHALALIHDHEPQTLKPETAMRTTIAALLLAALMPACDPIQPDGSTSSTTDGIESTTGEATTTDNPTTADTSTSGESGESTSDDTGSGSGSGGGSGDTSDEPMTCAPIVGDPLSVVCQICAPIWDAEGQVIGQNCCWVAQDQGTDVCLELCDDGCEEGFECRAVAVAAKLEVCWPE